MIPKNKSLFAPPFLRKGDLVAIVSTARKISMDDIAFAVKVIDSWGLKIIIGNTIGIENNQFAGSDEERADDFQKMLDKPEVKAIFCARGGYGTIRIMDKLQFNGFMRHPKWIIGYSDVTVLHNHVNQVMGCQSMHATMPINFETNTKAARESLREALFGEEIKYTFESDPMNRTGAAEGIVLGGNLSILYSLTGTKTRMSFKNAILFLEDLDEYLYHIDRMMMNLKLAGKLDDFSALLCGSFSDMHDNSVPFGKNALEIVKEYIPQKNTAAYNFSAGHIKNNLCLIFGKNARLKIQENICELAFI